MFTIQRVYVTDSREYVLVVNSEEMEIGVCESEDT